MRSIALPVSAFLCVILSLSTSARSQAITLSYPLDNAANAYTAPINSVLDHSGPFTSCEVSDGKVVAYTGESAGEKPAE